MNSKPLLAMAALLSIVIASCDPTSQPAVDLSKDPGSVPPPLDDWWNYIRLV